MYFSVSPTPLISECRGKTLWRIQKTFLPSDCIRQRLRLFGKDGEEALLPVFHAYFFEQRPYRSICSFVICWKSGWTGCWRRTLPIHAAAAKPSLFWYCKYTVRQMPCSFYSFSINSPPRRDKNGSVVAAASQCSVAVILHLIRATGTTRETMLERNRAGPSGIIGILLSLVALL